MQTNGHHDLLTCTKDGCQICAAESIKPEVLIRLRRLHRLEQWMRSMEMPVEDLASLMWMSLEPLIEDRIEKMAERMFAAKLRELNCTWTWKVGNEPVEKGEWQL